MREITTLELKKRLDNREKLILLDCRGIDYYLWEHLPDAVDLRWKYVSDRTHKIIKDKKQLIITYCDGFTCNASVTCYKNLIKSGYKNLIEYSGGIADWKAHGLQTVIDRNYHISENIYRFPQQTFGGSEVGSYLLNDSDTVVIVDGPQNLDEEHEDFIASFSKPVKVFLTHNPTGGDADKLQKSLNAKIYLHTADKDGHWLTVKPDHLVEDGDKLTKNLTVIHTPGHSPGSSCLYDKNSKALFSGDHLEGDKKGEIYDFIKKDDAFVGNVKERFTSVIKISKLDFNLILPFHYYPIKANVKDKIIKFINKYLKD